MKRLACTLVVAALALGVTGRATAADADRPEALFAAGNSAYEAGAYADAIDRYTETVRAGVVNADLYYNLGNAYFKTGDLGRSVLWYERALRIEPRSDDTRANLAMVRSLLRDQQLMPAQGGVRNAALSWHRRLTAGESVLVACAFYALFTIAVLMLVFRRTRFVQSIYRVASWISPARLFGLTMSQDLVLGMVITAVFALVFAGSANAKIRDSKVAQRAVVVTQEVAVYSGPSEDATIQFKVHEGTVVAVGDGRSGWVRVDLPGDLSGWVEERMVERI
ncbi:MAG TPA: tetratricopeptide repeat protein [Candidatus Krumholzibacteria bacterium]